MSERDELLDAADKLRSNLGFQVFGVELGEPPDIDTAAVISRLDYFGDTWYVAASRKLSDEEAEICLKLSAVLDALRASFMSREASGPAYDTDSGFDFDSAREELGALVN